MTSSLKNKYKRDRKIPIKSILQSPTERRISTNNIPESKLKGKVSIKNYNNVYATRNYSTYH